MLKNPEEVDATQASRWLAVTNKWLVGDGNGRQVPPRGWGCRLEGEAVLMRVWLEWLVASEWVTVVRRGCVGVTVAAWVRLKVERQRRVGVEEGLKVTRRGRQVWMVRSVALMWLS